MTLPAEKPRYTFADVLAWDNDERVELIDGEGYHDGPGADQSPPGDQRRAVSPARQLFKEFGTAGDKMKVNVLEDCIIGLSELFPE